MEGSNSVLFRASRNETFILHEIQRIFSEQPNWTGDLNKIISDKTENIIILKEVLIYCQQLLGSKFKIAADVYYYLLVPLISTFKNY